MLEHLREIIRTAGVWHLIAAGVMLVASTTVLAHSPSIATLMASSAASMSGNETVLYFSPYATDTLKIGDAVDVDVRINSKTPVNTIGATITFPQDSLEIVSISKEKSFLDLWTEETTIKES